MSEKNKKGLTLSPVPEERTYRSIDTGKKAGRPRKYATPEEAAEAKRERDKASKERRKAEAGGDPPQPASNQRTLDDEIADMARGFADAGPSKTPPREEAPPSGAEAKDPKEEKAPEAQPLVTGFVLLALTDALCPSLVDWIMRKRGLYLPDKDALRMSEGEREAMAPLADEAAKIILAKMNPALLYIAASVAITYAKAAPMARPLEKGASNSPAS